MLPANSPKIAILQRRQRFTAFLSAIDVAAMRAYKRIVPWYVRRLRHAHNWPVEWRERINLLDDDERTRAQLRRKEESERGATRSQLKRLAGEYKRLLINALTRVGAAYIIKDERQRIVKKVRILNPVRVSPEALWFQIDTARLPYHVPITVLMAEETIQTVSAACRRVVRYQWDNPENGFWFIVELKQGMRGVPREVDYSKMLNALKADAPPLAIAVGTGEAGRLVYRNIADLMHILVAGATGSGKSVWLKQVLTTLILRNTPARLKMIMIDLKGGVELSEFSKIPHLMPGIGIIKDKRQVVSVLQHILAEVDRRLVLFEKRGVVNISTYNQRTRSIMPYWIIVIDELANLMLDSIGRQCEPLLADIAARARAAGIHCIVATQRPSVDVITGIIKANFPARVAFSTASNADSRVIIDTGSAAQLSPVGRMIFLFGNTKLELQGPFITPSMVNDIVAGVSGGQQIETLERRKRHNFTPEDFFRHALNHLDGWFPADRLYETFRANGVSQTEMRTIARDFSNREVEVDGKVYRLTDVNYTGKFVAARRLLPVVENIDSDDGAYSAGEPFVMPIDSQTSVVEVSQNFSPVPVVDRGEADEDATQPDGDEIESIEHAQAFTRVR